MPSKLRRMRHVADKTILLLTFSLKKREMTTPLFYLNIDLYVIVIQLFNEIKLSILRNL
jgi:hypothetical protein